MQSFRDVWDNYKWFSTYLIGISARKKEKGVKMIFENGQKFPELQTNRSRNSRSSKNSKWDK